MMAELVSLKKIKPKSRFPAEFKVGTVVKMKSGGAMMTITAQFKTEPFMVQCEWHDSGFYPQEKSFPLACLRLATEDEIAEAEVEAEVEE
jgi:uncharacterized protein YodC (DUF2158 family)